LLDAVRARQGLEALVLVDERGHVLAASARAGLEVERIAADAVAPLGQPRMRLTLAPFRAGTRMLTLASIGPALADVTGVAEATRRIHLV
jgi:hypothetical protein